LVGDGVIVDLEERLAVGLGGFVPLVPIAIGGEAALLFDGLFGREDGGLAGGDTRGFWLASEWECGSEGG
jgi:hypothetical protein